MKIRILTALAAGLLVLSACGGSSYGPAGGGSGSNTATLSVSLMDGPFRTSSGTVTAVNIAIAKVEAVGTGGTQTIATFTPSKQINLLDYQTSALNLGTAVLPAGHYQQLRFVLDTSNPNNTSVVVNGTTNPLSIPSATGIGWGGNTSTDSGDGVGTSGIKINVGLDASGGYTYAYVIDFNAAESIVNTGSGGWLMKPVLVASAQATSGAISGTVTNSTGGAVVNAEVLAEQGGTVINSGVTDTSGNYQINALPAGSYTLVVKNVWTNQAGASETATGADGTADVTDPTAITVTNGQTATANITD
jgi:hypothetical protein